MYPYRYLSVYIALVPYLDRRGALLAAMHGDQVREDHHVRTSMSKKMPLSCSLDPPASQSDYPLDRLPCPEKASPHVDGCSAPRTCTSCTSI